MKISKDTYIGWWWHKLHERFNTTKMKTKTVEPAADSVKPMWSKRIHSVIPKVLISFIWLSVC